MRMKVTSLLSSQLLLSLVLVHVTPMHSERILMWMSLGMHSHFFAWKPLILELAKRGHHLTLVVPRHYSGFEQFDNVRFIPTNVTCERAFDPSWILAGYPDHYLTVMLQALEEALDELNQVPAIQDLYNKSSSESFDLLIQDASSIDFGLYLAKTKYFCPTMTLSPLSMDPLSERYQNGPQNPSFVPLSPFDFAQHMTFSQRLHNILFDNFASFVHKHLAIPIIERQIQKQFPYDARPDLISMMKDIDLFLINAHPALGNLAPTYPNQVQVGGIHLQEPQRVTGSLGKWMDEAEEGVVLVSFGTHLDISKMPTPRRLEMISALGKLKQRVVIRIKDGYIQDAPDNFYVSSWLPQQDVMAHPKTRLFVSHGGIGGLHEAARNGVPMVVIPCFLDQFQNAGLAERLGFAKKLFIRDLTKESLSQAMKEVLSNASYTTRAKEVSQMFLDNLVQPLDKAVYYTEYLMRHKGASHLKSASVDLNWFQLYNLDLILFLGAVSFAIFACLTLCLWRCCCKSARAGPKEKQH